MKEMTMRLLHSRLALLALSIPLAACTVEAQPVEVVRPAPPPPPPPVVVVHPPPPPLRYEPVPPPPPGTYVWRPGHWEWVGNTYAWIPGRYVLRQHGWRVWVPGHWAPNGAWIPAHWA
jgi:hypothetical protein